MHLFVTTTRFAKWTIVSALCLAPFLAMAADEDHVVTQVANGLVYVSLGTRDGVAAGQRIEVLDQSKIVVAALDLELCGEVICRAKLPADLAGRVLRGMLVRVEQEAPPAASSAPVPPPITTAPVVPTASASVSAPEPAASAWEEPAAPPPVPKKKKKPQHAEYTGLTVDSVLAPMSAPPAGPAELPFRNGPVPTGYRVVDRANTSLVKTGWWMFGISYGLGSLVALGGARGSSVMLVPVVGPFIYAATDDSNGYSSSNDDAKVPAVVCGLGQGIGALLLGLGYAGTKKFVREDVKVSVAPMIGQGSWGLGIAGTL